MQHYELVDFTTLIFQFCFLILLLGIVSYVSTVPNQAGQSRYAHCSPAVHLFFPLFNAHARYLRTVALGAAQRRDVAPGTHDPDPPATKSVNTSVKGLCFAEQKGAG